MKILWSPTAMRHFANWIGYIAEDSPQSAKRERTKILKAASRLKKFPRSGRMVPEFGNPFLREIIKKPIRIIYRVQPKTVEILALHHSRREFNKELFLTNTSPHE
ncbi:MAG: type II toxin-antitoxin system RelE/ParE family toxin [Deltaproteobacteria bacterium]|nr:type II toxin-antitoxin system RelE/ParE family toxin [Deltaproteobacteria bacterium]